MSPRTATAAPARTRGSSALPPWLRRRIGMPVAGEPAHEDPTQDRAFIARSISILFLAGATLSLVWVLLPHDPRTADGGVLAMTIGGYLTGVVLIIGLDRLPMAVLKASVTAATVVITGAMLANHENGSTYVVFYFWATIYAFSFFSLRQSILQMALVGIAFALVLVSQRDIWQEEVARWLLVMGTMTTVGMLVRFLAGALRHRALHDPLTGLPNRRLYLERLDDALRRAATDERAGRVAVVFLDLDGFKYVNDSLGHHAGDVLLVEVARRLGDATRDGDLTARFGGDEFAVLCPDVGSDEDALALGARVNEALAEPILVGDAAFHVSASVGVAISPRGAEHGEALLRDADAAMYAAKQRGRARCELFDEPLRDRITDRLRVEKDLRLALERDELEVHYQPIVRLEDGATLAVEALLRWRHPARGIVAPADFVTVAEETGLIVPIGDMVLDRACRQLAAWDAHGGAMAGMAMNVNLSARQLPHSRLVEAVRTALEAHGIEPSRLTVELTEGVLVEDGAASAPAVGALRELGVRIALDDFGTGFSSLSFLQRFPLDELKLDRAFVAGLGRGGREEAFTGAVLAMAGALGIAVIAEGIEDEAEWRALRRLGCTLGQGYLFARPATAAELLAAAEGREPGLRLAA